MEPTRNLPFPRGEDFELESTDTTPGWVGRKYAVQGDYGNIVLKAVRNKTGVALTGGYPVVLNETGTEIDGYATDTADVRVAVLDIEHDSVADEAMCYIVVGGISTVYKGDSDDVIADTDILAQNTVAAASTASGTTVAGVTVGGSIGADGAFGRAITASGSTAAATSQILFEALPLGL